MTPIQTFMGIPIIEHPLATTKHQAKEHRWRSGQSKAYHLRINKKWRKRFGTVEKPSAFMATDPTSGQKVLYVHPEAMARMRATIEAQAWRADIGQEPEEGPPKYSYYRPWIRISNPQSVIGINSYT